MTNPKDIKQIIKDNFTNKLDDNDYIDYGSWSTRRGRPTPKINQEVMENIIKAASKSKNEKKPSGRKYDNVGLDVDAVSAYFLPMPSLDAIMEEAAELGKATSLHMVDVSKKIKGLHENERTIFILHVCKWIRDYGRGAVFGFYIEDLTGCNKRLMLAFENQTTSNRFHEWLSSFVDEFEKLPKINRMLLWRDRQDFIAHFDKGIEISTKILPFEINTTTAVTETMDLWMWFQDNCTKKVWFYKNRLYFEDAAEAVNFKLTWFEDEDTDQE